MTTRKAKRDDTLDALYRAVEKYVADRGGKLVVIGGIQVIEWPGDGPYRFTIGIRCTGRRPTFADVREGAK